MSIFLVLHIRVAKRRSATGQARAALRSGCQGATVALEGPLAGRPSHGRANALPAQFAPTYFQGAPGAGPGGKDRQPLGRGQLWHIDAFAAGGRVAPVWQACIRGLASDDRSAFSGEPHISDAGPNSAGPAIRPATRSHGWSGRGKGGTVRHPAGTVRRRGTDPGPWVSAIAGAKRDAPLPRDRRPA